MDNKGWGLNTMLLMVCVILIALLIATFYAIRLNNYLGKDNNESEKKLQQVLDDSYYIKKTNEMVEATDKYISEMNITLNNDVTKIYLSYLVSHGYMNNIYDKVSNKTCNGYANAYLNADGIKMIKAYIKCDNYVSAGYGD